MGEVNKKSREANIELLRIIAMIFVIAIHCIGHGFLLESNELNIYNQFAIQFISCCTTVANALFLIITGYYMIDKKFNLKKILCLWGKTLFYCILIFIVFSIMGKKTYAYDSFLPIFSGQYWFICAYIALYFFLPIINIVLNKLTKKQFKYLIITLLIMIGVIRIIFNPSGIFSGAMIPVFMIYAIGAYLRRFVEIKPKKQYFIKYILLSIILFLIYILFEAIYSILDTKYSIFSTNQNLTSILLSIINNLKEYNSIIVVAMTVFLFMKLKTTTIKSEKISKLILFISPSVYSIYIIHENIHLRDFMWTQFGMMNYKDSIMMIPYMIFLILCVFIVCLAIDLIRRYLYIGIKKVPIIRKFIDKINGILEKFNIKINKYIEE